jgi:hypothetical protein
VRDVEVPHAEAKIASRVVLRKLSVRPYRPCRPPAPQDQPGGRSRIKYGTSFSFAGEILKDRYHPAIGRPAEDPEFLLRLCLLQYLYGDSVRQVVEKARLNLAYKYFLGLAVDAEVPDYTTVSYFRAQRLGEEKFRAVLDKIIRQCIDKGFEKSGSAGISPLYPNRPFSAISKRPIVTGYNNPFNQAMLIATVLITREFSGKAMKAPHSFRLTFRANSF